MYFYHLEIVYVSLGCFLTAVLDVATIHRSHMDDNLVELRPGQLFLVNGAFMRVLSFPNFQFNS